MSQELQRKVAEALGWRKAEPELHHKGVTCEEHWTSPDGYHHFSLRPWPTDIAVAWMLVDESHFVRTEKADNDVWRVELDLDMDGDLLTGYGKAPTAPEAIVRAFLSAKGVKA